MNLDVARIQGLLDIAERSNQHGNKLSNLSSAAIEELLQINAKLKEEAAKLAQAAAERAQVRHDKPQAIPSRQLEAKESQLQGEQENTFTSDDPNPNLERRV